ncbi:MAG: hypothetical protein ACR2N7_09665 [Acidimicrobiia bacterium]
MNGRPFLGVISGFFFGLFGAAALFLFGVIPLDSHLIWILPLAGVILGLAMAAWAPFGSGGSSTTTTTEGVSYASAGDAAGTTLEQEAVDKPSNDAGESPNTSS